MANVEWKTQAEIDAEAEERAWAALRRERDARLLASDWTQLPDVALTPTQTQEWQAYRRALRDLTDQPGAPYDVTWPTVPEG